MRFIIARSASAAALDSESAATRGRSHSRAAASQTCTLPSKAPHLLEREVRGVRPGSSKDDIDLVKRPSWAELAAEEIKSRQEEE